MPSSRTKEQDYFDLAFQLAYFIHVNKELAFFVAEDALDGLDSMLDHHERNRQPSERLRGFFKSGERTRPIRKTVRLNELQMLQWLVYKQSEAWERQSERGEGLYLPTEEDLIVRYIEHLVFNSLRRGSFYVTLAAGSLLHQFGRRETRLWYDILTQSDSARMKDTNYIGKRRLEMLEKVSLRFGSLIQTIQEPGHEKQFAMRATTEGVINLVNESLRRFTPWETTCVVKPGFDITEIPGLYFSDSSGHDEEIIEMNRIHTVLDPECFATFAEGLSRYVRTLPREDPDKSCRYVSLDERLRVPQFSSFYQGPSRGDRSQSPPLTEEDYIRLQRMLDARAHRRRVLVPQRISIYVDDVLINFFDPKRLARTRCVVGSDAAVVEVRGEDAAGEVTLATLLLNDQQAYEEPLGGSIIREGGQKVTLSLIRARNGVEESQLEVMFRQPGLRPGVFQQARRNGRALIGWSNDDEEGLADTKPASLSWAKAALAVALLLAAAAFVWWQLANRSPQPKPELVEKDGQPQEQQQIAENTPVPSVTASPLPTQSPSPDNVTPMVARATWSLDPNEAQRAVSLEATRSEVEGIDLSSRETRILLSLPLYDDQNRKYSRYRMTLSSPETLLWRHTLRAPRNSLTGYAHILNVSLFTRQLPATGPYDLQVDGGNQGDWHQLGKIRLSPKDH